MYSITPRMGELSRSITTVGTICMDTLQKLRVLGQHMALEPAEEAEVVSRPTGVVDAHQVAACGQTPAALHQRVALGIQSAVMPGGKRLPLLKTLLTSACERDCYYCPFRARRNFRRVTFKPEEMARTFAALHQAGAAEGLFLSSGIAGGGSTDARSAARYCSDFAAPPRVPGVSASQTDAWGRARANPAGHAPG